MFHSKNIIREVIIAILASLFLFTGVSKLLNYATFKLGMHVQSIPEWLSNILSLTLPGVEIIIAVALSFHKTRRAALSVYILMLLSFTTYTGLIVFNFFQNTPCGCGGIFQPLSWNAHFFLNLLLLSLAVWSLQQNLKPIIYNQEVS